MFCRRPLRAKFRFCTPRGAGHDETTAPTPPPVGTIRTPLPCSHAISGFFDLAGNIKITLELYGHATSPGPINRVIIGRLLMPIDAAENLHASCSSGEAVKLKGATIESQTIGFVWSARIFCNKTQIAEWLTTKFSSAQSATVEDKYRGTIPPKAYFQTFLLRVIPM
jgi:hypothetical protein